MPKKAASKTFQPPVPQPQEPATDEELYEYVVAFLQPLAKSGDYKAIETLGRMKRFDWFARPQPVNAELEMSEETGKRLIEIGNKLLAVNLSTDQARAILRFLETHSAEELQKADINIDGLRRQII